MSTFIATRRALHTQYDVKRVYVYCTCLHLNTTHTTWAIRSVLLSHETDKQNIKTRNRVCQTRRNEVEQEPMLLHRIRIFKARITIRVSQVEINLHLHNGWHPVVILTGYQYVKQGNGIAEIRIYGLEIREYGITEMRNERCEQGSWRLRKGTFWCLPRGFTVAKGTNSVVH